MKAVDNRARYLNYTGGFRDGAAINPMKSDPGPDYTRGYKDGQVARRKAGEAFAEELGYQPTELRLAGGS